MPVRLFLAAVAAAFVAAGLGATAGGGATMKSQLPFSRGKSFATLDDYLAHRERLGASDVPFFRKRPDGRYELARGRGSRGKPPEIFTREELLERFGFER